MKMPEATFCIWVNVSKLGTSTEITKYLIDEAKVNVNDGKFYGSMGEGHLRVVTGCFWDDKDCFDALDRMAELFESLAKKRNCIGEIILQEKNKGEVLWKKTKLLNLEVG